MQNMAAEIITTDDLREFKQELLTEITKLLQERSTAPAKRWLKSYEVRKLLGISHGKLQKLRDEGELPFTRIGGVLFYDYEDIHRMLQQNRIQNQ